MIFNIGGVAFVSVLMNNFLPVAEGDKSVDLTFIENYVANLIDILGVFPFVFVFWYVNRIVTQERIKIQIEQENHYLEQSIIETQLYNLKNQINPDFLFRKLNYFYHESLPYSPNLSKGISLLTDMMHYAIDDDDDNLKVSLQKEIKHIQNFVEINQLRFNGRLQVEFDIVGVEKRHEIMPLILITFVENALKYGELFDKNNPLKIRLKVEDNNLFFTTFNLTRRGPKEDSEGIGIDNTQKRLSLGYVDNYSLDIKHEPEFYEVALYIKLE
ncbi:sensor histidine kinase [Arcicella aurantiaca]|nr:histidine kinase [Arcicella aurantiaca]